MDTKKENTLGKIFKFNNIIRDKDLSVIMATLSEKLLSLRYFVSEDQMSKVEDLIKLNILT
jgi:hypothetical protein